MANRPIFRHSEPFRRQIAAQTNYDQKALSFFTLPPDSQVRHALDSWPSQRKTDPSLPSQDCKIPVGDGPYVRAKQVQLLERDPDRAIALFWAAINAGDRVDSALKDMAVVMKQQNRAEEAIQAIKSFRDRCSEQAQESLDNVMLDLYKKCGMFDEQISLLKHKLNLIHKGLIFNGKLSKTARSRGRKFQISVGQEAARLLGNLGWAYMQLSNFLAAEAVYRKALSIEVDNNKLCNLSVCLLKQSRWDEARILLRSVTPASRCCGGVNSESQIKSYERSLKLLAELETSCRNGVVDELPSNSYERSLELLAELETSCRNGVVDELPSNSSSETCCTQEFNLWSQWKLWEPPSENRHNSKPGVLDSSERVEREIEERGVKRNLLPMQHEVRVENVTSDYSLIFDNHGSRRLRVFRDTSGI